MLKALFHFARNGISTFPCHLILFDAILRHPIRSIDFKPLVFPCPLSMNIILSTVRCRHWCRVKLLAKRKEEVEAVTRRKQVSNHLSYLTLKLKRGIHGN